MKIGIIKEGKTPPDRRTPLAPHECKETMAHFKNLEIVVQPSKVRAYSDDEYLSLGIKLSDDMKRCDVLLGIKEVPDEELIDGKTYLFFSHTIKKQPHNKKLLQTVLKKNIAIVDYECLTNANGERIIAFGKFAGIVGAYNAFLTFGKKSGTFDLKRAFQCKNQNEMENELQKIKLPPLKIVITGSGRVAGGAMEILYAMKIRRVAPEEYFKNIFSEPVFVVLEPQHYAKRKDGKVASLNDYIKNPEEYESDFMKYAQQTDVYIACHFWDRKAPMIISKDNLKSNDFKIKVIADISCDVNGPIASTIRSSTIEEPIYGYNPVTESEDNFMNETTIAVMAVDNLPCELPRDSSDYFGKILLEKVLPSLIENDSEKIIERATIAKNRKLTPKYEYLSDYVK